ncbi:Reverse transcriptase from mobile element jockey protein [Mycena sanguinolenta]|uniref:Reverse transcriptase from mobile element jockey protein n=1 Tax=Mycena sanguinolenta TaxID=230812 RepID=A0A8H6Z700_9AGAR|nr:Reverse transcriptase from mobile element jockey protein [Mycena sanguinolenta]
MDTSDPEALTPRVMTYYQRQNDFTVTLRSDLAKDPDIQVVEVAQQGAPTVTFVNLYNNTTQREPAAERVRALTITHDEPTVYLGDTNLHHEEWSCEDKRSNASSRRFLEWMTEDDQGPQATLLNAKGEITYTPHDATKASSVIDLTFVNSTAAAADTIKDWVIDPSMSYGLKEVKQEDWAGAFRKALEAERTDIDPIMEEGNPVTDVQLDAAAEAITRAMQTATAEVGKKKSNSPNAKPWWNVDLGKAASNLSAAQTELKEYETRHAARSTVLRARKISGGFRGWSKGGRNYPMPTINRGEGRTPAVTHEDKCEALREELFQPPPKLDAEYHPDLTSIHADDLPYEEVTKTESSTHNIIRWAWTVASEEIYILMKRCLANGHHLKSWRRAIAVALRKPRKPDYSKPRAYRLIQLLECLGKDLEKIVARRLDYLAGRYNLIPPNQFGGRSNSSTMDALLTFTNDVQAAWNHGKVTTALTFDIKGYFDFVNHERLLCELRRKRIPLQYVKWTAAFLSDRQAAVCIDGRRGPMKKVENGIPQGSPVSPILSSFYSSELLEAFESTHQETRAANNIIPDAPTKTGIVLYVDDGKIYVSSDSLDTNTTLLAKDYAKVQRITKSMGLDTDDAKLELQHYTRQKGDKSPCIRLPSTNGTMMTVTPSVTVKWLGVYLDRRLSFRKHVETLCARAANTVNGLTMLSNTVRGLSQVHLRHLYKACVIPVMTYASAVWWTGFKYHEKELERVQRKALRLNCAAFRTTPITALEIEASVPPIRLTLDQLGRNAAIRLNKLAVNSPIIQRLPDGWRGEKAPSAAPPLPPTPERISPYLTPPWRRTPTSFDGRYNVSGTNAMEKEDAAKAHKERIRNLGDNPAHILIYTDGSQMALHRVKRVGAGVVIYHMGNEIFAGSAGLGSAAEVYDGEMEALTLAAGRVERLVKEDRSIHHLHFFADNTAALATICDPKPRAGQTYAHKFHGIMCAFLDKDPANTVEVAWSPGHCDILGNERADELAKAGIKLATTNRGTRSYALRKSKERVLKVWKKEWKKSPKTGHYAIANRFPPALKPTKHFKELSGKREVFGRLMQCRTGHGFFGEYYNRFVFSESVDCECGEAFQTREHLLCECPRYEDQRHVLRETSRDLSLPEILGTKDGIAALAKFLEASGAFTKTGKPRRETELPTFEDEPDPQSDEEDEGG